MTKKSLVALATLLILVSACGSGTADDESTAADRTPAASDEADADASAGSGSGSDGTGETDGEEPVPVDDDESASSDDAGGDSVEPGSDDDRSLVEASDGPLGTLLFADTIASEDAPDSARFEGRVLITGAPESELPGTFELVLAGGYDRAAEAMELSMDMSELIAAASAAESEQLPPGFEDFFLDPIQIVVIGDQGWMKWGLFSMFTGQDDVWIEMDADEVSGATDDFGFSSSAGDPTRLLDDLAAADASIEDLGVESVNGVEARHWRALVDLETLSAEATAEERAELETQFGDLSASEFPIDVWIGVADGLIYRYAIDLSSEAFFAGSESDVVSTTMTFDFFDYGEDLGITAPPADQILVEENMFAE